MINTSIADAVLKKISDSRVPFSVNGGDKPLNDRISKIIENTDWSGIATENAVRIDNVRDSKSDSCLRKEADSLVAVLAEKNIKERAAEILQPIAEHTVKQNIDAYLPGCAAEALNKTAPAAAEHSVSACTESIVSNAAERYLARDLQTVDNAIHKTLDSMVKRPNVSFNPWERDLLPFMQQNMYVSNAVPGKTRFRFIKRVLNKLSQFALRPQEHFNTAVFDHLNQCTRKIDKLIEVSNNMSVIGADTGDYFALRRDVETISENIRNLNTITNSMQTNTIPGIQNDISRINADSDVRTLNEALGALKNNFDDLSDAVQRLSINYERNEKVDIPGLRLELDKQISTVCNRIAEISGSQKNTNEMFAAVNSREDELISRIENSDRVISQLEKTNSDLAERLSALEKLCENNQALSERISAIECRKPDNDGLSETVTNNQKWLELVSNKVDSNEKWLGLVAQSVESAEKWLDSTNKRIDDCNMYIANNDACCFSSYSQSGEDIIVRDILSRMKDAPRHITYMDIGGNDYKHFSNTYLMYSQGMSGIVIEANPELAEQLSKHRPRDLILNIGVGSSNSDMTFYTIAGGGYSSFNKEFIDNTLKNHPDARLESTISVPVLTFDTIVEKYCSEVPTIVSIDIEGDELPVLSTIDFSRYRPLIFIVESIYCSQYIDLNAKRSEIVSYMKDNGYHEYAFTGINSIFVDTSRFQNITGE